MEYGVLRAITIVIASYEDYCGRKEWKEIYRICNKGIYKSYLAILYQKMSSGPIFPALKYVTYQVKASYDLQQVLTTENWYYIAMRTRSPDRPEMIYLVADPALPRILGGRLDLSPIKHSILDYPPPESSKEIEVGYVPSKVHFTLLHLKKRLEQLIIRLNAKGIISGAHCYICPNEDLVVVALDADCSLETKVVVKLLLNGHREPHSDLTMFARWRLMW